MMFLAQSHSTQSARSRNARFEVYVDLLDADPATKAFCREKMIKVFPEMMKLRFVGYYDEMVELIQTHLAPGSVSKQSALVGMLELTY